MKRKKMILQKCSIVFIIGLVCLMPTVLAGNTPKLDVKEFSWGRIVFYSRDYSIVQWGNETSWVTSFNMSFTVLGIGRHNVSWEFSVDGFNKTGQPITASDAGFEHLYMFQAQPPHIHMMLRKNIGIPMNDVKNATGRGTLSADGNLIIEDTFVYENPLIS